ncbi:MAG TPA: hypothetical protein VNH46_02970 [Gemmatimonadales bacterium]|nr:hypothetical protein [Gemmatimonadales bacterium]
MLAAVIGVLSCKGDPTSDLRNGVDHLLADPGALFADSGATKNVVVTAVDAQGNLLGTHFALGTVGAGITVVEDDSFNLVYDNNGNLVRPSDPTRARYIVTTTVNTASTSFTVTAGGKSITIPVRVLPASVPSPTVSNNTPGLGDTVTMTLPAPFIFLPTTGIVIFNATDTSAAAVVNISADGRTIFFVPRPGIATSNVAISGFGLDYAPTAAGFNSDAIGTIATPALPTITFAPTTAAEGDTITATSTGPFRFTATSATTVSGGAHSTAVAVSTDSTQLKFIIGPSSSGTLSVSGLEISGAPALGKFTLTAGATVLTTPASPNVTIAPTTGVAGDTITVTAPAAYRFTKASRPTVSGAGLLYVDYSADSTSLRFITGPSANAQVVVSNAVYISVPALGLFTLNSGATKLTTAPVPLPVTLSTTTPAINDTVTMTVGAAFRLLPNASVSVGGKTAFRLSISADSQTMTFITAPGAPTGPPTVSNIALSTLLAVPFTAAATTNLTPAAALTGAATIATAPTLTIPAAGVTETFADGETFAASAECDNIGVNCVYYKLVLPTDRTFKLTLNWNNTADIGGYFVNAAGTDLFKDFACDQKGSGASGQPESCTTTLTAGTYYLGLANFSATAPSAVFMTFSGM